MIQTRLRPRLAGLALPLAALLASPGVTASESTSAGALRIIAVDVEGGAATLYITPQGHSVLIDTGWPAGMGGPQAKSGEQPAFVLNSAERIAAAAKAAGVAKIDYLVVTHYHVDHVGGVADLLKLMPVGTVIDHGRNRENPPVNAPPAALTFAPSTLYPAYVKAIEGLPRRSVNPGDTIDVDGLRIVITNSSGALVPTAMPGGGGAPGADCAAAVPKAEDGGDENARSLGFFMTWGKTRIFAGGDTTWNVENAMACPTNRIGPIDLYVANHHGSALSNSPAFLKSIAPRVVLFDNGPTKGGDAESFDSVRASPRLQGLWQLHSAVRSPAKDEPAAHIANLPDTPDGKTIDIAVGMDGVITLTNGRDGHSEAYRPGKNP